MTPTSIFYSSLVIFYLASVYLSFEDACMETKRSSFICNVCYIFVATVIYITETYFDKDKSKE